MFRSLSFKLSFFVGLILLGTILAFAFLVISHQENAATKDVIYNLNRFSDTLIRSSKYAMMTNHRENIESIVEAVGRQKWVERIWIVNKEGIVSFSTDPSMVGKVIHTDEPACVQCHRSATPPLELPLSERSWVVTSGNSRFLGMASPIFNEPGCSAASCHAHTPDRKMLGVLSVLMSLVPVDEATALNKRNFFLLAFALFFVTTIAIIIYMHFVLGKPVAVLAAATRRMAAGDYKGDVPVRGHDAIGALAESFDLMRSRILEKTILLEKSRDAYQDLFERVPCYITVQDQNLTLMTFNRLFEKEFGPVTGEYCYQAYKRRSTPCENCMVLQTFRDGKIHSTEEEGISREGEKRFFLVQTAPIRNDRGQITSVMEMSTDITTLRYLQDELEKSELKYRIIFNNVPNAIFVLEPEKYRILDVNDRALPGYGYRRGEFQTMTFLELSPREEREPMSRRLAVGGNIDRVLHRRKDGSALFVNVQVSPSEYGNQKVLIVATHDITASLETEQQLIQAAKMATLGEMATGVAHELNQPLSIIKTAASVMIKRTARGRVLEEEVLKDLTGEIDSQVDRASLIINHMREFGRKSEIKRQPTLLNEAVRDAFMFLGQQLKLRNIEIDIRLQEDLPPIMADKQRLEQVFVNLLINARDAIEEKREHHPTAGETDRITVRSFLEQANVVLTLADTGAGMTETIRERVFEPFFTTKAVGKGTGLGLSISYGIIRDYDGSIEIESEVDRGSVFTVRLPAREVEV